MWIAHVALVPIEMDCAILWSNPPRKRLCTLNQFCSIWKPVRCLSTWPCFSVSNNSLFYSNHFPGFFKHFILGCYAETLLLFKSANGNFCMQFMVGGGNFLFTELCTEEDSLWEIFEVPFLVNRYSILAKTVNTRTRWSWFWYC